MQEKDDVKQVLLNEFLDRFGAKPTLFVHSPGRINIIGEHIDYHDGYVMPAAIDLGIDWALKKNDLNLIRGYSLDTGEDDEFDIIKSDRVATQWLQYLQGIIETLKKMDKNIGGVDVVIKSDLPIGGGLSSSSSLATGFAFALSELFNLQLTKRQLTEIACKAEYWYGTRGGNMDHFAISHGKKNNLLFFDIRNFEFEHLQLPKDVAIVIFETTVRHNQKSSPYAKRRAQAESGLAIIKKMFPEKKIEKFRDVTLEMLSAAKSKMTDVAYRRSLHAVTEMQRVLDAKEAVKNGDIKTLAKKMSGSHLSLRDNYEVTCPELDMAYEEAGKIDGLIGRRMCGGGFGGCTVNLVEAKKARKFATELKKRFKKITKLDPPVYICHADDGVRIIK